MPISTMPCVVVFLLLLFNPFDDPQIDAFMNDFPAARTRAVALDQQILQDATAISQNYADLVSLGTRQAMAGVEITLSMLQGGRFNLSDVMAFMKDVGNSQSVLSC
jgi:hypothetical protein